MDNATLLQLILLTPIIAAAVSALYFRRSRWGAPIISVVAAGLILVFSLKLLLGLDPAAPTAAASLPGFTIGTFKELENFGLMIDKNGAMMLFAVTFVAFWIHVFSIGYMDDDKARGRFFTGLSIFMFSIVGIIVSDNLFMTFIFWELVGFCSYMLIAHYFDTEYASMASKKAFIANRVGDFGFLIGIILCYKLYGTTNFSQLETLADTEKYTAVGLLLMCGFLGKSAQFPLHVWLTDAMAGPTPVSALIHAATMVAAGVFFMVRVFFLLTDPVLDTMLWICAGMAACAGIAALGQTDIKKSLAYSTLSHLGFMGAAIGLRMPEIALLHMGMHAFFKATLFLCSGSVIHACHHEQDMTKMGGLLKKMPITAVAFVIAGLSISAFPWFAGWYSKDMILSGALLNGNIPAFVLLVIAAIGTTLYIGRMFAMVFLGKAHSHGAEKARESSPWMTVPLVVLGVIFSLGAGWSLAGDNGIVWLGGKMNALFPQVSTLAFSARYHSLHHELAESGLVVPMLILGIAILVLGLAAAVFYYRTGDGDDRLRAKHPAAYKALEYRYFDNLYRWYIEKIQQRVALFISLLNAVFVEGLGMRVVAAGIPATVGSIIRRFVHTGNGAVTIFWIAVGAVAIGVLLATGALN
ncbi:MAG: NADH-quinone oxidoreductase subunit L [Opitutae bacterium]|nr:NADH-quinone oxidoreductase subunit L [Opitutae bacterium]